MDTVNTVEFFKENVKPTVQSAALTAEDTITLTFSEKVQAVTASDFEVFVGSETTARALDATTPVTLASDGKSVDLKLATSLTADDLTKDIIVKKATGNAVVDTAGNALDFTSIVVAK